MILLSMGLVLVAFVLLLLGVLGFGDEPLRFVYGSIGLCLLAAVLLVAGVLRRRPARMPQLVDHPHLPSWSGARGPTPGTPGAAVAGGPGIAPPVDTHGPFAGAGGDDPEHARFVEALAGIDLDRARIERLRGRFVTAERLTAASVSELTEVPGISEPLARAIHNRVRARD